MLIAVFVQLTVPLAMLVLPSAYGWISMFYRYYNQAIMNMMVVTASLHGAFSTIIMVIVHRPYRESIMTLVYSRPTRNEQTRCFLRKDPVYIINIT
uniref:G protein-coupled receptor n=1 Tax=Caenorhabditis tropicalis TaxID=1561998 RepID=A0A1I7TY07_9PELO